MKRSLVIPAAIAGALHLLVLFGVRGSPTVPIEPPSEETTIICVFPHPVAPLDEPVVLADTASHAAELPRGGDPLPGQDETPPIARPDVFLVNVPILPPERQPGDFQRIPTSPGFGGPVGGEGFSAGTRLLSLDQLDSVPRATAQPAPVYPFEQRRLGASGTVTVTFVVDENGYVRDEQVVASDNSAFDEAALRAIARWRFEPGRQNGRVVAFRMAIPMVFRVAD